MGCLEAGLPELRQLLLQACQLLLLLLLLGGWCRRFALACILAPGLSGCQRLLQSLDLVDKLLLPLLHLFS